MTMTVHILRSFRYQGAIKNVGDADIVVSDSDGHALMAAGLVSWVDPPFRALDEVGEMIFATTAQIAAPTAAMLANRAATYIDSATFARYKVDAAGTALELGGSGGVTAASILGLNGGTALTAPAAGDQFVVVDVSDTTESATGTAKPISWADLFRNPVIIGSYEAAGAIRQTAYAIPSGVIDTSQYMGVETITTDKTYTFSGTPAPSTWFAAHITNGAATSVVVTIPSSYSMTSQSNITAFTLRAGCEAFLMWRYNGASYRLFGEMVQVTEDITLTIDGGGAVITTGAKAWAQIDYNATILSATLLADQSGSIVIDIWKDTYANYPPTVADTITASAKPTISSASKSTDSTLTGWTKTINAGDVLKFNVDSVTSITKVTLVLKVEKT